MRLDDSGAVVGAVLDSLPERLLKKEFLKAVRNITGAWSQNPPSEAMLRSPRRLLEKEAYRGAWSDFAVDPSPYVVALRPLFMPPEKVGYFVGKSTSALWRRIQKAIDKEMECAQLKPNVKAHEYAILRAALTLYHEEHNWHDEYQLMSDMGIEWFKALLRISPTETEIKPKFFLKDFLMFICWENYGLSDRAASTQYLIEAFSAHDLGVAKGILNDISQRARVAYQGFQADEADRILEILNRHRFEKQRNGIASNRKFHLALVRN